MSDPALVHAALQHFPPGFSLAFAGWVVPVGVAATAGLCRLSARGLLRPLRRALAADPDLHWTERSRLAWPVRRRSSLLPVVIALSAGIYTATSTGPFGLLSPGWRGAALALLLLGVGVGATLQATQEALPRPVSLRDRLRALLVHVATHLLPVPACLAAGLVVDPGQPWTAALALVLAFGALLALHRGAAVRGLLWAGLASPAPPRLQDAVRRAAVEARAALPQVVMLRSWVPNAYALQGAGILLFTEGAVRALTPRQVEAVAAHELGHMAEGASLQWLRRLPWLVVAPLCLWRLALVLDEATLLVAMPGYVVAIVGLRVLLRRRLRAAESEADGFGHHHGEDYARALEAVYRGGGVPAVLGPRRVHPSLYDRMREAGIEPDWPPPEPPPSGWSLGRVGLLLLPILAPAVGLFAVTQVSAGERVGLAPVVLTAGAPAPLLGHARTRAAHGGDGEACTDLMHLSCALRPDPYTCAEAAIWLAELGRCSDAQRELERASVELLARAWDEPTMAVASEYLAGAARWVGACESAPRSPSGR